MNDAAVINCLEENRLIDELINYLIDLSNTFSYGLLEESRWDISSRGNFVTQAEKLLCVTASSPLCERLYVWPVFCYSQKRKEQLLGLLQRT